MDDTENHSIWNTLHDAYLVDIRGKVPGTVKIKVEIEYLANRLPGNADYIFLDLYECSYFQYELYETKNKTILYDDLNEISKQDPIVLSFDIKDDKHYYISCAIGILITSYKSYSLSLADGTSLSFNDLDKVCEEYWDEFEKRAQSFKNK